MEQEREGDALTVEIDTNGCNRVVDGGVAFQGFNARVANGPREWTRELEDAICLLFFESRLGFLFVVNTRLAGNALVAEGVTTLNAARVKNSLDWPSLRFLTTVSGTTDRITNVAGRVRV